MDDFGGSVTAPSTMPLLRGARQGRVGNMDGRKPGAMMLHLNKRELAEVRRANRILNALPRARFTPARVRAVQALVRLGGGVADLVARGAGVDVETRTVTALGRSVPVRILKPRGESRGVHLDMHGGAWAVGAAFVDDPLNIALVRALAVTVVSVDYRLASAAPITDAIADCETAAAWVLEAPKFAGPVTLGGESAGAHLALCTLLRLRDRGMLDRVRGIALLYGCYDLCGTPSLREVRPKSLVFHGPHALADLAALAPDLDEAARRTPALSPLHANLAGLPPALIVVGAEDPLLDDSLLLAEAWQRAGGTADLVVAPESPHAFNRLDTALANRVNALVRRWIAARLANAG